MEKKKNHPKIKSKLHPRNRHNKRYDFEALISSLPELKQFVSKNKFGDNSINFFNPKAVKALNKALLKKHYSVDFWEIPQQYLCPPIPGRADYIHYIADLLGETATTENKSPKGPKLKGLDVGVGANCIYPIIGNFEYGWTFIGSDTDEMAITSAKKIVDSNPQLKPNVEIRFQDKSNSFFRGILNEDEKIDFTICNPPFHESAEAARQASSRKNKNLKGKLVPHPTLNFGGQSNELWYKGGELRFIKDMIYESKHFGKQCFWFTSLVSKSSNLRPIQNILKKVNPREIKIVEMGQGQKISRFIAWTFLSETEQKEWVNKRW